MILAFTQFNFIIFPSYGIENPINFEYYRHHQSVSITVIFHCNPLNNEKHVLCHCFLSFVSFEYIVPNILYWHPSAVHSRYPPIKLDPDIGSFDWQVKRLEEFYNNLDRSQENVEKLQVCEAVARAEFYTNQILVNSDEDSVYRIDLIDEQDYAKLRFKISLQAPNRLWTLPKWVCLDNNVGVQGYIAIL
jgi:hypothetical protein